MCAMYSLSSFIFTSSGPLCCYAAAYGAEVGRRMRVPYSAIAVLTAVGGLACPTYMLV